MSDENFSGSGEFAVGFQIAGYRLEEQIGRGGMAVVYRALDVRLDRHVALKILAPGLAVDDAFRQRFIRESRAAAAVDHPHIIPVFEAGEANGVLFIAMRYVHGGDVRRLLDTEGPLSAARAADIITQVSSALDAAHAHGLVHRDVKPGNILLDSTSGSGRQDHVYLSDFGLSKQALAVTGLTSTGQFLGTLDYVAPEQIEGRLVDGRADLYALACASFEMLCGTPPFRRDQGGLAVVWAQLSEAPPSLCARRADLPADVDAVMSRAMAKSPGERYPTCLAFAAALGDALGIQGPGSTGGGSPVVRPVGWPAAAGSPAGSSPGGQREPRDHPATEIPAAGAAAGLGAGAAWGAGSGAAAVPGAAAAAVPGAAAAAVPGAAAAPGPGEGSVPAAGAAPGPGPGVGREPDPVGWPAGWTAERPAVPQAPGGPPTEAAVLPRATRPGSTDPHGAYPPSGQAGYQPPAGDGGYPQGPGPGGPPRRAWWRSPAAVIIACVIVLGAAGGAFAVLRGGGGGGDHGATATTAVVPGCTAAVANAAQLKVHSATVPVQGGPFAVKVTPDGKYSFVTLGNSIAVLSNGTGLTPKLVTTFSAPGAKHGAAFTNNGRYLLAAAGSGAIVINTSAAEHGSGPIFGTLTSPYGSGAVEVAVSPDDNFAFVTLQSSADLVVFNLHSALTNGIGPSDVVGKIKLGQQPVGMAISPDGKWLYVTSMTRIKASSPSEGTVTVIDLHRAEVNPAKSVVSTAAAGCDPVRVITSPDGSDVWVTSRESDALLGFSAAKLRTDPAHALIARVNVGSAPIGLIMVRNGSRILVANSNLRNQPGATPSIAVVSTALAKSGGHALLGVIQAGQVPREFGLEAGGKTVLVTDNGSKLLQAIDVGSLP